MPSALARTRDRPLRGHDLRVGEAAALFEACRRDLPPLALVADELRCPQVGDVVSYVLNRNKAEQR